MCKSNENFHQNRYICKRIMKSRVVKYWHKEFEEQKTESKNSFSFSAFRFPLILLLLVAFVVPSALAQRRSRGFWHQEWTVDKGDTIPLVHILPIRKYARKPDMRRYQRLIRQVKKCYPLAKQARIEMEKMERQLLAVKDKKEQEKLAKELQKQLIKQYTPVILKMTISEGKVLLKLIDRETEYTAYQIIKDFRGGFVAGFWQMFAKMFGNNLKLEYEPETKDRVLEQIVTYYEMGWL